MNEFCVFLHHGVQSLLRCRTDGNPTQVSQLTSGATVVLFSRSLEGIPYAHVHVVSVVCHCATLPNEKEKKKKKNRIKRSLMGKDALQVDKSLSSKATEKERFKHK